MTWVTSPLSSSVTTSAIRPNSVPSAARASSPISSLLQVVLQISCRMIQIYPVPDCLLRQLCQDLGHPVEVVVEGLFFAQHVFQGDTLTRVPLSATITPDSPSARASTAAVPSRLARILSEAVGCRRAGCDRRP